MAHVAQQIRAAALRDRRCRRARLALPALLAVASVALATVAFAVLATTRAAPAAGASSSTSPATPPKVSAISPNNGASAGGTLVRIDGTGFSGVTAVFFGGVPAASVTVKSATTILARSPPGSGTVAVRVRADGSSEDVAQDQFAYDPPPHEPWLGLNGNNSTYLGDVRAFVAHGIVFDRSGPIEWTAGEGLAGRGAALETDLRNGMIPVVTIEYRGYSGRYSPDPAFPTEARGSRSLSEYVAGFLASASAILAAHPGRRILFEPINEPWGYTSPQFSGAEYAAVIARLLPAAREAHIPPESIYVGATGKHWVEQMYAARAQLRSEVEGWYLHPYGPPGGSLAEDSSGIESVPRVQAEMESGQNNLIVSELGFCALDVNAGRACGFQRVAHSVEAAALLTTTLERAGEYHRAGWLRALLVYSRNDGGWAMQLPHGVLTAQGEALDAFADPARSTAADAGEALSGPPLLPAPLSGTLLCALAGAFVCGA